MIDIDAPIPYVITREGKQLLEQLRAEDACGARGHTWRLIDGVAECRTCPAERTVAYHQEPHQRPVRYRGDFKS